MSRLAGTLAAGDARWGFLIRFLVVAAAMLLLAPAVLSDFRLSLLAKFLCFAIVAVGIGLAWGQGGMLVLGQGLFFGLGGYSMGMYMKLEEAGPGQLPDFMVWSGVESLPAVWAPFRHAWFALPMAVLLPMAVAAVLGTLVFRQRVRGAYFAILSQGLAAAFVIVLVGQQGLTGGTNGLTNFTQLFGLDLTAQANASILYTAVALGLLAVFLIARQLVASRYGRVLVAVRDSEDRVRFLGYDPTRIKVVAYTAAAGMAGLAGAMFVPIVGIISPALLGILPSIEMVIWVALGGRAVLAWAAGGAVLVNWVKTGLSERFPSGWLYLFGMVFVVVIAFAPKGMAGIGEYVRAGLGRLGAVRLGPRARDRATARDRAAQEPA